MSYGHLFPRRTIGANAVAQFGGAAGQLLALPLFLSSWSPDLYGAWLLVIGLLMLVSVSDLGFCNAAATQLLLARGRGRRRAVELSQGWLNFSIAVSPVLSVGVVAGAFLFIPGEGEELLGDYFLVALTAYVALFALSNALTHGLRAVGQNDFGAWIGATCVVAEVLLPAVAAASGFKPAGALLVLLAVRLVASLLAMRTYLKAIPEPITGIVSRSRRGYFLSLAKRGLSGSVQFCYSLVYLQLPLWILTLSGNASEIGAFSALRTLSRLPFQISYVYPRSIIPSYTTAFAKNDFIARLGFEKVLSRILWVGVLPAYIAYGIFGQTLLNLWSGGRLSSDPFTPVLLGSSAFFHTAWNFKYVQLLAMNRLGRVAVRLLAVCCLNVLVAWLMVSHLSSSKIMAALLVTCFDLSAYLVVRASTRKTA